MDNTMTVGGKPEDMVSVCAWSPDAREQTMKARAEGKVVSHGLCPTCAEKWVKGTK